MCFCSVWFFFKIEAKRHVLNQRIMCVVMIHSLHGADWGAIWAAVMTDTGRLRLVMRRTAWKEQPQSQHNSPLIRYLRRQGHFLVQPPGRFKRTSSRLTCLHVDILCWITFSVRRRLFSRVSPRACQGPCSKWPSFLTFADISHLMRVKSSRLDD